MSKRDDIVFLFIAIILIILPIVGFASSAKTFYFVFLIVFVFLATDWIFSRIYYYILSSNFVRIKLMEAEKYSLYLDQKSKIKLKLELTLNGIPLPLKWKIHNTSTIETKVYKDNICNLNNKQIEFNVVGKQSGYGFLIGVELIAKSPLHIYKVNKIKFTPMMFKIYPKLMNKKLLNKYKFDSNQKKFISVKSGYDLSNLSKYESGDEMRHIAWKKSTKNNLYIKRFQPEVKVPFYIYLDCEPYTKSNYHLIYKDIEPMVLSLIKYLLINRQLIRYSYFFSGEISTLSFPENAEKIIEFELFSHNKFKREIEKSNIGTSIKLLMSLIEIYDYELLKSLNLKDIKKFINRNFKGMEIKHLKYFLKYNNLENNIRTNYVLKDRFLNFFEIIKQHLKDIKEKGVFFIFCDILSLEEKDIENFDYLSQLAKLKHQELALFKPPAEVYMNFHKNDDLDKTKLKYKTVMKKMKNTNIKTYSLKWEVVANLTKNFVANFYSNRMW